MFSAIDCDFFVYLKSATCLIDKPLLRLVETQPCSHHFVPATELAFYRLWIRWNPCITARTVNIAWYGMLFPWYFWTSELLLVSWFVCAYIYEGSVHRGSSSGVAASNTFQNCGIPLWSRLTTFCIIFVIFAFQVDWIRQRIPLLVWSFTDKSAKEPCLLNVL